jgi:glycosyltransferase involved in cell wall biosynthesis
MPAEKEQSKDPPAMTILKLCLLANPNSVHIQRWATYFVEAGYEVHMIGEHPLTSRLPARVTFHDLTRLANLRKLRYLGWALALRGLLPKIRPDILHAHNITSAGWLAAASGFHPTLVTSHGSDLMLLEERPRAHTILAKWVLRQADYVTCVSQLLAKKARQLGAPAKRVEVAPLGVDLSIFHPGRLDATGRPGRYAGDTPVILSLRAIRQIYNPMDIAAAIPIVLKSIPEARFVFPTYNSDAPLLKQLQNWIASQQLSHAVDFIPPLEGDAAIAEMIRGCDVAISVPASDGTPASVLEAMACQKAVILSDIPALHEWATHERECLYVTPGDIQALSQAMIRLLEDNELRRELGENARALAKSRADRKQWMHRYDQLYRDLKAAL